MAIGRALALAAVLLAGLWPSDSGLTQTRSELALPNRGLVLGYYVPYDTTSWASLQAHADQFDVVAAQWATIDACGGVSSHDDQTLKQFAHDHGMRVEPSLLTGSASLNHRLLTDDATRAAALQNIVAYTVDEGYDGFDLDFEGVAAADRDALSAFVNDLSDGLHSQGKLLTVAVPAEEHATTSGWAGAFDYAAIGGPADLVTIMAYEFRGPFNGPGSVAPYDWVSNVAAYAGQQIEGDKVLLGLSFFGYDWNVTSGGTLALGYPRAMALAAQEQATPNFDADQQSLTFDYTADGADQPPAAPSAPPLDHQVTTRAAGPCDVPSPAPTPAPRRPVPQGLQTHQVWLEDSQSAASRLGLADGNRLRGIAAWRLGFEDPGVWPLLDQWRATTAPAQ